MAPGGVGRNIAENLARLGTRCTWSRPSATTPLGDQLLAATRGRRRRRRSRAPRRRAPPAPTPRSSTPAASWSSRSPTWPRPTRSRPADVERGPRPDRRRPPSLVLDGNLAPGDRRRRARPGGGRPGCRVVLDPVSVPKAGRLADRSGRGRPVHLVTPERGRARRAHRPARTDDRQIGGAAARTSTTRGVELGVGPARASAARCSAAPTASHTLPATARRGRRRDRRGRRDAGGVLPRACSAVPRRPTPRRTGTRPPRSPSPARTPSAPTSPTDSSETPPDMTPHPMLPLTDEVAHALRDGDPVVALESTIISHGMPYPDNVAMAQRGRGHHPRRRRRARDDRGARRPAPVGLSADDLELLASHADVDQGQRPRPAVRRRPRRPRRDHGRGHDAAGGAGRHPGVRHRRPRRRAPRRAADLRHLRRPHRARPDRRGGRQRRA